MILPSAMERVCRCCSNAKITTHFPIFFHWKCIQSVLGITFSLVRQFKTNNACTLFEISYVVFATMNHKRMTSKFTVLPKELCTLSGLKEWCSPPEKGGLL